VAILRKSLAAIVMLMLAFALPSPASAQDVLRLAEQDIKAGLLYNFLRYTQWPPSAQTDPPAVVCIYGGDPFGGRLTSMAGRTVNQRQIQVRVARSNADFNACSLLVINSAERSHWPQLRSALAHRNILTVSDYDGFAREGGMIEFTRINSRIGVRINVGATTDADLNVQDRLLRLANIVRTDAP
jgi:hypothetical protein